MQMEIDSPCLSSSFQRKIDHEVQLILFQNLDMSIYHPYISFHFGSLPIQMKTIHQIYFHQIVLLLLIDDYFDLII